ncbi:hypothetical protein BU23DRAFT_587583 [Bimuria novae-zelandiae CBS 107.79]|uniref:ATPase domain-containing protein n=1 Tax=Bimuria novae-zelandiae CBS 107.79 TaxID=1447943 RepID=A0A6A5VRW2_9PLEO|nr:hypothetical protein BU23DRAFT_587583 [Bimuria novae-zelandiae CBS 107.79]
MIGPHPRCLFRPTFIRNGRHFNPTQRRFFFGMCQILGVMANPAETLRQLNESRDMLRKAKEDIELTNEAKKIPPKHTFSKLPGFYGRKAEQTLLRRILLNTPKLTVVFGATSVGKTALLREVPATDDFYVIKFDLRISGFADLRILYITLCEYGNGLTFRHLKLEFLEKEKPDNGVPGYKVTVADLASLMESLQSCLLKYWEYEPEVEQEDDVKRHDENDVRPKDGLQSCQVDASQASENSAQDGAKAQQPFKKRPVIFLMDEAYKLPALVNDQFSLKVFLDSLLVLTKQDRLCHVILSTSDSFFHHFLRRMNVSHHSQILTIGDCSKEEPLSYFLERIDLYDAFGGKLAHFNDYVSAWTNNQGATTIYESAIFMQAYTLLQFHLTRPEFETYSPLSTATATPDPSSSSADVDRANFQPKHLIYLCREIGTDAVDSLIQTRILELRWTKTVSPEEEGEAERVWFEGGVARPVVLPMTRIVRRAMEVVLREVDGREARGGKREAGRKGVEPLE